MTVPPSRGLPEATCYARGASLLILPTGSTWWLRLLAEPVSLGSCGLLVTFLARLLQRLIYFMAGQRRD